MRSNVREISDRWRQFSSRRGFYLSMSRRKNFPYIGVLREYTTLLYNLHKNILLILKFTVSFYIFFHCSNRVIFTDNAVQSWTRYSAKEFNQFFRIYLLPSELHAGLLGSISPCAVLTRVKGRFQLLLLLNLHRHLLIQTNNAGLATATGNLWINIPFIKS